MNGLSGKNHLSSDVFRSLALTRQNRAFDLAMLELFNSKERDADEWSGLLREADERFKLVGIKRPLRSKLSFIEIMWEGNEMPTLSL